MFRLLAKKIKNKPIIATLFVAIVVFATLVPNMVFAQELRTTTSMFDYIPGIAAAKYLGGTALSVGSSALFQVIGTALMAFSSLLLLISGWMFDGIVNISVINMSNIIGNSEGLGGSITEAWATIRDIANMFFIFILLYTAFRTMFMSEYANVGRSILHIIVIAILINFSLFFTKVVIDASNIVSDGFYRAIATTNKESLSSTLSDTPFLGSNDFKGISGGYMRMLGLQTWFSADILRSQGVLSNPQNILIIGLLSSIFLFVSAIVLFMAAIMFAARFIILILLMILSPFAFIAYIIPGQSGKFSEWVHSLLNQAFFAPVFFALTWIVFKVGSAFVKVSTSEGWVFKNAAWVNLSTNPKDTMGLVLNFIIIIGLSIAALVLSKQMASKGATAGAFGTLAAVGGAATFGAAGLVARNTVGRFAANTASNKDLQERAAMGETGARLKLWAAQKGASTSFDTRALSGTKIGKAIGADKYTDMLGKAAGEGGFKGIRDAKTDKRRKPIDDAMRQFRSNPRVLAAFLERQGDGDQLYMYDKLSPRDRAAVDEELDKKYGTTGGLNPTTIKLRGKLSPEEKEKTEKASKEARSDATNRDRLDTIHKIATDPIFAATFTPVALDTLMSKLPPKQARKISHEVRLSPLIIPRLTIRHLTDLMSEGDLQSDEIAAIRAHATPAQTAWMTDPTRLAMWTP